MRHPCNFIAGGRRDNALLLVIAFLMKMFTLFKSSSEQLRSEGSTGFLKAISDQVGDLLGGDAEQILKRLPADILSRITGAVSKLPAAGSVELEKTKKYVQNIISETERVRPSGKKILVTKLRTVPGPAGSDDIFYSKILSGIGAPVSPENKKFMYAWRAAEGGAAAFNPFNTTKSAPGATNYNSVGVKNYISEQQGIESTIKTLLNGKYNEIVGALRDGGAGSARMAAEALARSPWGTGDLALRVLISGPDRKPIYRLPEAEDNDETIHMIS